MKTKTLLTLAIGSALFIAPATQAVQVNIPDLDVDFYGVLDYSMTYTKSGAGNQQRGDDGLLLENNFTRLGIRGTHQIAQDTEFFFRGEVQFKADDQQNGKEPFTSRPTYLGLRNKQYGEISFGRIDPTLKMTKAGADIFGLTNMTFNRMFAGNMRFGDSMLYKTPVWNNWQAGVSYVFEDDSKSNSHDPVQVSVTYGNKKFNNSDWYLALAYGDGVEDIEAIRGVIQYKWDAWKFGAIVQDTQALEGFSGDNESYDDREGFGYVLNTTYQMDKWKLKFQYSFDDSGTGRVADKAYDEGIAGLGDEVPEVTQIAFGGEYKFTKQFNFHFEAGQYLVDQDEYEDFEDDIVSLGIKYAF